MVFTAGTSSPGDVDMMDDSGDTPQLALMNFNTFINN